MLSLFCFGLGYTAKYLANRLEKKEWTVGGTVRSSSDAKHLQSLGYRSFIFNSAQIDREIEEAIRRSTHILVSIPPDAEGDPCLRYYLKSLEDTQAEWIGYLSTIGVYGDHAGQWVDEDTPPQPKSERSQRRVRAETEWLKFGAEQNKRVKIFRLSGIYGPERSVLEDVQEGSAITIFKQGQVFNRIHVQDIAQTLFASFSTSAKYTIYNVTDDEPSSPQEVNSYAAKLLGLPPPPEIPIEKAQLSEMAHSFYAENKRVRNERIKKDLGVNLSFPTYREGLSDLVKNKQNS